MRVTYQEVGLTAEKTGICQACGKRATRRQKFFQTINPFNKNENGYVKNRFEIQEENRAKARLWEEEPVYHQKCE